MDNQMSLLLLSINLFDYNVLDKIADGEHGIVTNLP